MKKIVNKKMATRILRRFDDSLNVKPQAFRSNKIIYHESTTNLSIHPNSDECLILDDKEVWFLNLIDFVLNRDSESFIFYLHLHDNIVLDITLLETFDRDSFVKDLKLFLTNPAKEGGSNILGVCDLDITWMIVIRYNQCDDFLVAFYDDIGACDRLSMLRSIPTST